MKVIFESCDRCHGQQTKLYPVWVKGANGAWVKWFCFRCEGRGRALNEHRMTRSEIEIKEEEAKLKAYIESSSEISYEQWKREFFPLAAAVQQERPRLVRGSSHRLRSSASC